jgi:hypothetical protein
MSIRDDKSFRKVESNSKCGKSLWVNDNGKYVVTEDIKGYSYLNDKIVYDSKEDANKAHTTYYKVEVRY